MRTDKRYTRTLEMITAPEIPRTNNGGIKLCRHCQRQVYFCGGFLEMLQRDLEFAVVNSCFKKATA